MSINISPTRLVFDRPLTTPRVYYMHIKNNGLKSIAFKVKTTTPKIYSVSPKFGFINSKSEVSISVTKFAMQQEPDINVQCNDKFLLLLTYVDSTDINIPVDNVWNRIESRHGPPTMGFKIPCLYQGTITGTAASGTTFTNANTTFSEADDKDVPIANALVQQLLIDPQLMYFAILTVIIFNMFIWWF